MTFRIKAALVPPPGVGFTTVRAPVPTEARSVALRLTVRVVAFTRVVGRALPFHFAVDSVTKPAPVKVICAAWFE